MSNKKITPLKWVAIFITSIIMGALLYLIMVQVIFKPNLLDTYKVAMQIISNIGHPALKLKAYIAMFCGILPLIISIIWFFMPTQSVAENYGNARFATSSDFEKMGINHNNGLILGALIEKGKYKFIRATKPLSTLIVAPPGRGKTSSIIITNLLSVPNSSIVYDIKGELYQKTAGYRQQKLENEIQLFQPFSWDNTLFFNPFDKTIVEKMEYIHIKKLAEQIASTIFVGEKGKENDHWIVSAKTMFVFFVEYFLQKNKHTTLAELSQAPKADYFKAIEEYNDKFKKDKQSNPNKENSPFYIEVTRENEDKQILERDFTKDTFKVWLKQTANDEDLDENTRNQARAYSTAAEQEFASIKSTYDTFMKVFSNPQVANATNKMSFTFEDLRNKKITMYIVIQTEDMEILAPLVRIFTESLFKKLMSGNECSDPNKFIYCYLDEFVRFGKMPFLLEAPALCRSYGLLPIYVTQSYEQIKKYYGEDDLGIIRANAGYQTIFAMNTTKDAKEVSELIGDFTREKISNSKGNFDFFKNNQTRSNEAYKLVTEQDIKNQSSEDLLVLVGGFLNLPIKSKVPYWFKNSDWNGADKIELKENKENETNNNNDEVSKNNNEDNKQDTQEIINNNIDPNDLNLLGIKIS
ncbi:type IV secretory system conjugative DNA transfer family protein [Campylobacter lanienae]|uniref:type IV secretory system conjugative DNA transfer family protein n=1 Tax=Campylobacter lanienae TaxID=75658 RepID=UPI000BB44C27|nr:type IV secretory system conjugative DNA transfer family protein [Campylobacter lanienae]